MAATSGKDRRAVESYLEHGWDAMEDDDPEAAEEEARRALLLLPDTPEAHYLLGASLVDQERFTEALEHLTSALTHYPGDPSIRLDIAAAHVGLLHLDEGIRELTAVVRDDPDNPDARYWLAIAHELHGHETEAAACYAQAAELDSECFFVPVRVTGEEFAKLVDLAVQELPPDIKRPVLAGDIGVHVMELPSPELLRSETPPLSPLILGLHGGEPGTEQAAFDAVAIPPKVFLFQRNIERIARSREEFVEEIAITLLHEIAHHLGLDEEDVAEYGLE